jgi:glutathione peroxidase
MKLLLFAFLTGFLLTGNAPQSVHEFKMLNIDEKEVDLSKYKGKVIMIVNTASKCGLTPQYADLQAAYEKYKDKDFVILGFPANNFMGQEPGSNSNIKQFCSSKFKVTFPMFAKISVKGKNMHPLYQYLTQKDQNGKVEAPVSWNFQKFLIGKDGKVVRSFSPSTKVNDPSVVRSIERMLMS